MLLKIEEKRPSPTQGHKNSNIHVLVPRLFLIYYNCVNTNDSLTGIIKQTIPG